jgi:hypothetical protein
MPLHLTIGPETKALLTALIETPLGETVTYAALSERLGRDVTGPARGLLTSARHIAARDHGAVFRPERGVGLVRLTPDEAADIGATARRRIRTGARRATGKMAALAHHSNGLSPDAYRRMNREIAQLGVIEMVSADHEKAELQDESGNALAPVRATEEFLRYIGAK